MAKGILFIGTSARLYKDDDGQLFIEKQSISGLHAWKKHFDRVIFFTILDEGPIPEGWERAQENGIHGPDFEIVPIPDTYRLSPFSKEADAVKRTLLETMKRADYVCFAYGGWLGDPGEIGASLARANGIKHAVWFDRVESQVAWASKSKTNPLKALIMKLVIQWNEKRAAKRADLALLHGKTVYQYFKDISPNPHLVEDIHFLDEDRISKDALAVKREKAASGALTLLYVGRADPMKGGRDWVAILGELKKRGVAFHAKWYGDGSDLEAMKESAAKKGLTEDQLTFMGFVSDQDAVKAAYQEAQLLVFCHLTDESPRNLIESLHCATPLIGYRDPFAASLVEEKGAGILVKRGDEESVVDILVALDGDRDRLSDLIERAGQSASHLTRDSVFQERSEIIKKELAV